MGFRFRRVAVPVLIVAAGVAVAVILATSRKAPERRRQPRLGPLVEAIRVHPGTVPVIVTGNGTVRAKVSTQLIPQVAGRIVSLHPALVAGGFFRAGEVLVTIDPADYELAVKRAQATVTRAEVQLELARADARIAAREWERSHPGQEPPSPLVVKKPQLQQAEAELAAARADLEKARLDLARTRLSLPFDGRVVSKSADVGQYVAPGQTVATVYGTAVMEIPVPLQDADLAWFAIPGRPGGRGARAEVSALFGGRRRHWRGRVVRTEGEIDPQTRMVHVVVEVAQPPVPAPGAFNLLPGMFVGVAIHGRSLEHAFTIPRFAVHQGTVAWVVRNGRLRFKKIRIARYDGDTAVVTGGLADGDVVVTSQLEVVSDGMKVRTAAAGRAEHGGAGA